MAGADRDICAGDGSANGDSRSAECDIHAASNCAIDGDSDVTNQYPHHAASDGSTNGDNPAADQYAHRDGRAADQYTHPDQHANLDSPATDRYSHPNRHAYPDQHADTGTVGGANRRAERWCNRV
jgi:hypothetical protein